LKHKRIYAAVGEHCTGIIEMKIRPKLNVPLSTQCRIRFIVDGEVRDSLPGTNDASEVLLDLGRRMNELSQTVAAFAVDKGNVLGVIDHPIQPDPDVRLADQCMIRMGTIDEETPQTDALVHEDANFVIAELLKFIEQSPLFDLTPEQANDLLDRYLQAPFQSGPR